MGKIPQEIPNTRHVPQPRDVKKAGGYGSRGLMHFLNNG